MQPIKPQSARALSATFIALPVNAWRTGSRHAACWLVQKFGKCSMTVIPFRISHDTRPLIRSYRASHRYSYNYLNKQLYFASPRGKLDTGHAINTLIMYI